MSKHTSPPAAAGGVVERVLPSTITDFTNQDDWLPIDGDPDIDMVVAAGGVSLDGNLNRVASSEARGFAGVVSMGRIFPQLTGANRGKIELYATFDSYVRPSDMNPSDTWQYILGLSPNEAHQPDTPFVGYGGLSGGNQDHFDLAKFTGQRMDWVTIAAFTTGVPAASTFTIKLAIEQMAWDAGTSNSWAFKWIEASMDGGGGPLGGVIAEANSYCMAVQRVYGMRVLLGCYHDQTSQIVRARLTSFQIVRGVMVKGV